MEEGRTSQKSDRKLGKGSRFSFNLIFNVVLAALLTIALIFHYLKILPVRIEVFILLSFIGLAPVLRSAVLALINRYITVDLLASIALIFSFLARDWYSATFINLMLACARIFSLWTDMRARDIISHLLKYRPVRVKIKKGERIVELLLEQVKIGDLVVIESGDRVPVDGVVVSGQASINESTLTGESEPITKTVGDRVLSSTLNESGSLLLRAEKIGEDTTLSRIIALIEEASLKKSKSERIADKFTRWYILFTLAGSVALYLILGQAQLVLAVLLVACADDIAVAIPLAFTVSIARAAERGILIKGADVIESLSKIKLFMTDKTGTLTYGKPKIRKIVVYPGIDEKQLLELLGTTEINSRHPVGLAIVNYAKERGLKIVAPDEFNELPGEGMSVKKEGKQIFGGKIDFLKRNGILISEEQTKEVESFKDRGFSITALGMDKKMFGFVVFEDGLRHYAKAVIMATKNLGVEKWIMLTGDNEKVAARVSHELGVSNFKANLRPEDKLKYIENFKKDNKEVIGMMGDGVNDAAALALADVSIAMGVIGSDAAIEAADVALIKDDLKRIPDAILLGKKTMMIIRENFWIWGVVNGLGLVLVFASILNPVGASAYNFLTDFIPIFNALWVRVPSFKI